MKKLLYLLLIMSMHSPVMLNAHDLYCDDDSASAPACSTCAYQYTEPIKREDRYTLQCRASYYRPSSDIIRKVYPHAIVDWGIEGSKILRHNNEVWAGVDWVSKHGCSLCFEERSQTRLSFVSISTGIKHFFKWKECAQFYLGAGPCYTFMHIHDQYPYVQQHISEYNLGALFKGGFRFIRNHFLLELFTDYFCQHISCSWCPDNNVQHRNVSLNGIRVGGGIGFKF